MTDCERVVLLLSAYYDGELDAGETELVREHLDTCEPCAALLRFFGDASDALRDAEPPEALHDAEPPEALRERVMAAVRETAPLRRLPGANTARIALRRIVPAAACLAVILLALPLMRNIGCSGSAPDMTMSSGAPPAPSMQSPSSPAAASRDAGAGGSYAADEMMDNPIYEMAEAENGSVYAEEDGDAVPGTFGGGLYDDVRESAEADAAPPSASPGEAAPAETPPPQTPMPQDASDPQAMTGKSSGGLGTDARIEDYSLYYAVIKLTGEIPQILNNSRIFGVDAGQPHIFITRAVADTLIAEGYDYELYNAEAAEAVVILVP